MDHLEHNTKPRRSCIRCRKVFQAAVLQWAEGRRRSFPWRRVDRSPYELVLAEVLLQQTRAEHVAAIFEDVVNRCPDWPALAKISVVDLEDLLRPLGLQRRRAAALHALAEAVVQGGLPQTASGLEKLPGIGQYMARAIAAQLSMEVVAPIDTNVARVLERVFGPRKLADIRHDPGLQRLALSLVPPSDSGGYLVALIDFGAIVCRSRVPQCAECPVGSCRFRSTESLVR